MVQLNDTPDLNQWNRRKNQKFQNKGQFQILLGPCELLIHILHSHIYQEHLVFNHIHFGFQFRWHSCAGFKFLLMNVFHPIFVFWVKFNLLFVLVWVYKAYSVIYLLVILKFENSLKTILTSWYLLEYLIRFSIENFYIDFIPVVHSGMNYIRKI